MGNGSMFVSFDICDTERGSCCRISDIWDKKNAHNRQLCVKKKGMCSVIKPLRDHRGTKRVIFMQIPFKHFRAVAVFVLPGEAAPYVFTHIRSYNNTTETPATTAVVWHRAR